MSEGFIRSQTNHQRIQQQGDVMGKSTVIPPAPWITYKKHPKISLKDTCSNIYRGWVVRSSVGPFFLSFIEHDLHTFTLGRRRDTPRPNRKRTYIRIFIAPSCKWVLLNLNGLGFCGRTRSTKKQRHALNTCHDPSSHSYNIWDFVQSAILLNNPTGAKNYLNYSVHPIWTAEIHIV